MNFPMSRSWIPAAAALLCAMSAVAADNPEAAATKEATATKRVNINQASAAQLALLPRVGAKAAERIVEYRKAHGSFSQPEELMEVKGIGEKLFLQLKPYLTLSGPTTLSAKVRSTGMRARATASKKTASNSVPVGKGR